MRCLWKECTAVVSSAQALFNHLDLVHRVVANGNTDKITKLVCRWEGCTRTPRFRDNALDHLRSELQVAFPACSDDFDSHTVTGHARYRPFGCSQCPCAFSSTRELQRHLKKHAPGRAAATKTNQAQERENEAPVPLSPAPSLASSLTSLSSDSYSRAWSEAPPPLHPPASPGALSCQWSGCTETRRSADALFRHLSDDHVRLDPERPTVCRWDCCDSAGVTTWRGLVHHVRSTSS